MIYLDHASTSWPKPAAVLQTLGGNPSPNPTETFRPDVLQVVHAPADSFVRLTSGGRRAIEGLLRAVLQPGDHVVTTELDHDAVRDTLEACQPGIQHTVVPRRPGAETIAAEDIRAALQPATALVMIAHASNVTGAVQPLEPIADVCRRADVPLMIDAAQTAGRCRITLPTDGRFGVLASTHKALLGPRRTGFVVLNASLQHHWQQQSAAAAAWVSAEEPFEVSPRMAAAAATAVHGLTDTITEWDADEAQRVGLGWAALSKVPGVEIVGPTETDNRLAIFAFRLAGYEGLELAALLRQRGLWVAGGSQRSSWLHEALGTGEHGGLTRISLGRTTGAEDLEPLVEALAELAQARC